jgi:hypothetical protein
MSTGVQTAAMRNMYPAMSGGTLGQQASASSPYSQPAAPRGSKAPEANGGGPPVDDITARALQVSLAGKPLPFWLLFIGLIIALGFAAKKLPGVDAGNFKSIDVSFYNILVIAFAAMIGITFFKIVFTKWPVPGLSAFVLAV